MRIVCEVYKLTKPSPEEAMSWMTTAVRHGLRWGRVDTAVPPRPPVDDEDEDGTARTPSWRPGPW
ncbi:hypothetical protein [Kitasatospora sp. A2-31]|uniref:hypothetical protein n=1 Tax=Kitasatospora sp. A2-31 TaxID=2916414 RepID=UPI001EEF5E5C|nr:hypothetical protein [Kitasatospora sp. A2-31]MCG6499799.1 hypothetical protein [Kitasatospora sp. A2-31]